MTSIQLNTYITFGYLACAGCWLMVFVLSGKNRDFSRFVLVGSIFVFSLHTASIGLRWYESYRMGIGHVPLSNLYESLVFFAWSMALALILFRLKYQADILMLVGTPLVFLTMAYTFLQQPDIKPLIPALQSNWLAAHVITCFLGYAGFAVSFIASILLLISSLARSAESILPDAKLLDEIVYRAVLAGLPMLSLGIITGAAWADYAWGAYWSWDPKETWSLVTWLVYSAFLHARIARGWSGKKTAALSVLGFAAVMFTYFGVNYLPGLHSYQ